MEQFDSCLLKIQRAEEHFQSLTEEISWWNRARRSSIEKETDQGREHAVWVSVEPLPALEKMSLITSDCIHNLRCALNHLVYAQAIVDTGINPPWRSDSLQFPIVDSADKFAGQQKRRLSGLNPQSVALIESVQPYHRQKREGGPPLLTVLRELDNSDKHRLVNLALFHLGSGEMRLPVCFSTARWLVSPLEGRTKTASFTSDPPTRDSTYAVDISLFVTIRHIAGPNGSTVIPLLGALDAMIREVKWIVAQC